MDSLGPWIFASAVVLVVGFLVYRYPRPTLIGLGILLATAAVGTGLLLYWSSESARRYAEERAKNTVSIPVANIELQQLQLGFSGVLWRLNGTLLNKDAIATLTQLIMRIRVYNCASGTDCPAIGETNQTIYLKVPPSQARQLDEFVSFSPTPSVQAGSPWHWEAKVMQIEGEKATE